MFETLKIIHLIFVISWFAGLLYLPRLFVYHAMATDKISLERFKIMERKLYHGIMTPAMIISIIAGLGMLDFYALPWPLWIHIKMGMVALLIIIQLYCGFLIKQFRQDTNQHSHIFYRILNEIPLIPLVVIISMVVLRPV